MQALIDIKTAFLLLVASFTEHQIFFMNYIFLRELLACGASSNSEVYY